MRTRPAILWALAGLVLAAGAWAQESGPADESGIAWQADLDSARELAAASGRPLALYFTFDT